MVVVVAVVVVVVVVYEVVDCRKVVRSFVRSRSRKKRKLKMIQVG